MTKLKSQICDKKLFVLAQDHKIVIRSFENQHRRKFVITSLQLTYDHEFVVRFFENRAPGVQLYMSVDSVWPSVSGEETTMTAAKPRVKC